MSARTIKNPATKSGTGVLSSQSVQLSNGATNVSLSCESGTSRLVVPNINVSQTGITFGTSDDTPSIEIGLDNQLTIFGGALAPVAVSTISFIIFNGVHTGILTLSADGSQLLFNGVALATV